MISCSLQYLHTRMVNSSDSSWDIGKNGTQKAAGPVAALHCFHSLQKYKMAKGVAQKVDYTSLISHTFEGDLSLYLDGLDTILNRFQEPVEEALLHTCIEPQLGKCKALAIDFQIYERAEEGDSQRSVQFLYDASPIRTT